MNKTSIEWTDKTWNPTRGCSRVSEGCRNCYAERIAARFSNAGSVEAGEFVGFATRVNGHPAWTGKVELIESKLTEPLHWRKPCRIFVNSMSDLFHEALPHKDRVRVFSAMRDAPQHTYQVLTKRGQVMKDFWEWWCMQNVESQMPSNWWLGVSVEDQATADERVPLLLQTPAAVRFVSYEPALGPVDFSRWLACEGHLARTFSNTFLDQIIVGGESGPGARPFDIAWPRSVIAQCKEAGVACFVKQLGSKPINWGCVARLNDRKGGDMSEWPPDLRVRETPRSAA